MELLELTNRLIKALKAIEAQEKRCVKARERSSKVDFTNSTPKQIDKAQTAVTWEAMDLEKRNHECRTN